MAKFRKMTTKEGYVVYYPYEVPLDQAAQDIQRRREEGTLRNEPPPGRATGPAVEQIGGGGEPGPGGSLNIGMRPEPPVQEFDQTMPEPQEFQEQPNGVPMGILRGNAQPQLSGNSLGAARIGAGLQGMLFEGGDEVLGMGQAALDTMTGTEPGQPIGQGPAPGKQPMPFMSKYDYYRDRARALDERLLNERPSEGYGLRIGGAIASSIGALPKLSAAAIERVAPEMAKRLTAKSLAPAGGALTTKAAATLGDKMVDGAVQGMIGGGLAGFNSGESEDPEAGLVENAASRVIGGVTGSALGAGIGAAIPPVAAGIGGAGRWLGQTFTPGLMNPEKTASRVLAQNVGDDLTVRPQVGGVGPVQQMAGPAGNVIDDLTLADVSPGVRATLGHVARGNGPGARHAQDFINARQEGNPVLGEAGGGMWTKMLRHIREGISSASPKKIIDAVRAARAKAAEPAYKKAFLHPDPNTPESDELLQNVRIRSGARLGAKIMKDLGELPESYKLPKIDDDTTGIPVKVWHIAKMGLDAQHQALVRQGKNLEAAGVDALRKRVLSMLDDVTDGDYTKARQQYAGYSALLEATENGAEIFSKPMNELADQLAGYSDGEKQLFVAGMAQALVNKVIGKGIDANSAWIFFKSPDVQMRLGLALEPGAYQAFIRRCMAESEKFKSFMELKGSQTDYRQNIGEVVEEMIAGSGSADSIIAAAQTGGFRAVTGMLWRTFATNAPRGLHGRVKDEIAKMATETDPVRQQKVIDGIFNAARRVLARQNRGRNIKAGATGAMQGSVGGIKSDTLPDNSNVPPPGFKQASDGAYYGPDPARPGKFLKWEPD